jgi:hypothetical protein
MSSGTPDKNRGVPTKRSAKRPTTRKTKVSMDTPNKVEKLEAQPAVITSYKGFDSNWQCRGFQYTIGGEYTHTGDVEACSSGFHACEYPLDVFGYYPPTGSKFATVEQSGKFARDGGDSKVASAKLRVVAELSLAGIIKAAIEYTFSRSKPEGETATGNQGAASATGNRGAASATGDQGAASATGTQGAASATGNRGAASATGYQGAASATGYQGAASATGYRGAASATGNQGAASATGNQGAASATGNRGAASATGDQGAASATGNRDAASATGYQGAASATGKDSVAMSSGWRGQAKAADGCALFLVFRDDNYKIVHAWAGIAGRDGVKADTWYVLDAAGKPAEVTP